MIYSKGKLYKFVTVGNIFYTGTMVDEDEMFVKIETIRDETVILNKQHIIKSTELDTGECL